MDNFWQNLSVRLAAPRKKKEEAPAAPAAGPMPGDGYSYTGFPDKDEYYFDGHHPTSRLGKGSWKTLRDGTEVFVDQKGNVRAGGKHTWHGKNFDDVTREHTRALASMPPEERANLKPVRPSGFFTPSEDGQRRIDPDIRQKYQGQNQQNFDWLGDKQKQKDRLASRMLAENNYKVNKSNGISFLPFKDYSPAHQDALAAAHAQSEKMGDLADIQDPNARAEWARNHAANIDNLTNSLDNANLGDGVNMIGDRADGAKKYATNPTLLDRLPANSPAPAPTPTPAAPVKKTRTQAPAPGVEPAAAAPTPQMETPEPAVKKTRAPRKSKSTPEMPTPSPAAPPPTPSSFYPQRENIIQDDLSAPTPKNVPAKTPAGTYFVDPKYRREEISASKALKLIIKNSSKLG